MQHIKCTTEALGQEPSILNMTKEHRKLFTLMANRVENLDPELDNTNPASWDCRYQDPEEPDPHYGTFTSDHYQQHHWFELRKSFSQIFLVFDNLDFEREGIVLVRVDGPETEGLGEEFIDWTRDESGEFSAFRGHPVVVLGMVLKIAGLPPREHWPGTTLSEICAMQ